MARRKKVTLLEKILHPTIPVLENKLVQSKSTDLRIIFMISQVDGNLYSFICGIVTNLPISILFNLLDMKVGEMPYKWLYFMLYILLLIDTVVMTVAIVKFTLQHIGINEKAQREKVAEASVNTLYTQVFGSMKSLRKEYWTFMISFFVFILFVLVLFAINNIDISWLLSVVHITDTPPVTP